MATLNTPRTRNSYKNKDTQRPSVSNTRSSPTPVSTKRSTSRTDIIDENYESIVFIWFDPQGQSNINLTGQLRAINDNVQMFTDSSACLDAMRSSEQKVFFICLSSNNHLIATAHDFPAVEAIFVFDPNAENIKGDFPKLFGIFNQQEQLFRVLKEVLDLFEEIQLEDFAFEHDKIFLWSQLWKEDVSKKKN